MEDDINKNNSLRILSHQLKSPVNAIQSLLQTITEGYTGEINDETMFVIKKAVKRAEETKEMISDLLDYELYGQETGAKKEPFNLANLLKSLLHKYSSQAAEKDIVLNRNIPENLILIIEGEEKGIEHGLRNLIENAIKYTPGSGNVEVSLETEEESKTCSVIVSDTGYGIPAKDLETIFEPFHRSVKHKSNISGTGLGLAIVKRVAELHGGTVHAESRENEGSVFTFTLPYSELRTSEEPEHEGRQIVIIGGVTAGPKAAARLRRLDEDAKITIVERGESLSYTGCGLPHYISGRIASSKNFMTTADNTVRNVHFFENIKNIRALNNTEAVKLDIQTKKVTVQNKKTKELRQIPYDTLILATGATPVVPKIPGIMQEGIYTLNNLADAENLRREFEKKQARDVFILGGGMIGISLAESLIVTGARITIFERSEHILPSLLDSDIAIKLQNEMNRKGIKIVTNDNLKKIEKTETNFQMYTEKGGYSADIIIVSAGVRPNSDLAREGGLEIGESGGVKINEFLRTSDPDIYAVGDCAESFNVLTGKHDYWPLGAISTKMGRMAADAISGNEFPFPGSINTALFRIFDINVGRAGLTEINAREHGFSPEAVVVAGLDRSHYCEDAFPLFIKVIADRKTKQVLGIQIFGRGDIFSRITVFSAAITAKMKLQNVFSLDLGYNPPFNTPIDIVQTACSVLDNKIRGYFRTISPEELDRTGEEYKCISVSPLSEYTVGSIPGSINIPLENLRRETPPFSKNEKIVLYSGTSGGAYEAARYLEAKGFQEVYVLEGGFQFWER